MVARNFADNRQAPRYPFTVVFHQSPVVNQNKQGEDVAALVAATSLKQKRHIQSSRRLAGRVSLTDNPARTCDGFGSLARSLPTISFMKALELAPRLRIIGGCALAI